MTRQDRRLISGSDSTSASTAAFLQKQWSHTHHLTASDAPSFSQTTIADIKRGEFDMFRGILTLTLSLCLCAATAPVALAQTTAPITEQEAHAIAVDAYVYFYSIMSMDISRKQFTNGTTDFRGPMHTFVHVPEYPPADFKGVVRSNFDTLYSVSWLDMTMQPVVISAPDTNERYYLLPMLA